MNDFAIAFHEGLEAATRAEDARKEIDNIFEELNAVISTESHNTVVIERYQHYENPEVGPSGRVFVHPLKPRKLYWAITAYNPKVGRDKLDKLRELAKWDMDPAGYPCTITWSKQEHICEDGVALSRCLTALLKDPVVGENLRVLMRLSETTKQD